jgi:hypothetical protein
VLDRHVIVFLCCCLPAIKRRGVPPGCPLMKKVKSYIPPRKVYQSESSSQCSATSPNGIVGKSGRGAGVFCSLVNGFSKSSLTPMTPMTVLCDLCGSKRVAAVPAPKRPRSKPAKATASFSFLAPRVFLVFVACDDKDRRPERINKGRALKKELRVTPVSMI